jgi:hypothetical protein
LTHSATSPKSRSSTTSIDNSSSSAKIRVPAFDDHQFLLVVHLDLFEDDLADVSQFFERILGVEFTVLVIGDDLGDSDRRVVLEIQEQTRGVLFFRIDALGFDAFDPVLPAFRRIVFPRWCAHITPFVPPGLWLSLGYDPASGWTFGGPAVDLCSIHASEPFTAHRLSGRETKR